MIDLSVALLPIGLTKDYADQEGSYSTVLADRQRVFVARVKFVEGYSRELLDTFMAAVQEELDAMKCVINSDLAEVPFGYNFTALTTRDGLKYELEVELDGTQQLLQADPLHLALRLDAMCARLIVSPNTGRFVEKER